MVESIVGLCCNFAYYSSSMSCESLLGSHLALSKLIIRAGFAERLNTYHVFSILFGAVGGMPAGLRQAGLLIRAHQSLLQW